MNDICSGHDAPGSAATQAAKLFPSLQEHRKILEEHPQRKRRAMLVLRRQELMKYSSAARAAVK